MVVKNPRFRGPRYWSRVLLNGMRDSDDVSSEAGEGAERVPLMQTSGKALGRGKQ